MCERLTVAVGETVNIAVPEGSSAISITQVRGPAAVTTHNWVGQRTPVHATSSGKVLLAYQPVPIHRKLIGGTRLKRSTARTIVSSADLLVQSIRDEGNG